MFMLYMGVGGGLQHCLPEFHGGAAPLREFWDQVYVLLDFVARDLELYTPPIDSVINGEDVQLLDVRRTEASLVMETYGTIGANSVVRGVSSM